MLKYIWQKLFFMLNILITSNNILLIDYLKKNILESLEGTPHKLIIKTKPEEALGVFDTKEVAITIADINLVDINGIEFFYQLNNKNTNTHKIIFSDKYEDYIKSAAYDVGVDDFITDQITSAVLQKKITQIFNRLKKVNGKQIYYNSLIIDKAKFLITHEEKRFTLPKKQFLIYALLCTSPGEVFTRDEIYNEVWNEEMPNNNRTVDVHIRQIRKIIPKNNIKTFRGIGYKVDVMN